MLICRFLCCILKMFSKHHLDFILFVLSLTLQVPGPYGPGGVSITGFAMFQHQIKAVHDSAHQEEKQRQDLGDLERRPHYNTRSPTVMDRDGEEAEACYVCCCFLLIGYSSWSGSVNFSFMFFYDLTATCFILCSRAAFWRKGANRLLCFLLLEH